MDNGELYKTIFETWRFQIDSYWTRSSYFAVFETAALAGVWQIYAPKGANLKTGMIFSLLGIGLTIVWYLNNRRTHRYVQYWWRALIDIEKNYDVRVNFVSEYEDRERLDKIPGKKFSYHTLIQSIPGLFLVAWIWLLFFGIDCKWHIWHRLFCG